MLQGPSSPIRVAFSGSAKGFMKSLLLESRLTFPCKGRGVYTGELMVSTGLRFFRGSISRGEQKRFRLSGILGFGVEGLGFWCLGPRV